jgi:hypothetical protein
MALHQEAPESGATPQPYSREVLALHARQLSSLVRPWQRSKSHAYDVCLRDGVGLCALPHPRTLLC